MSRRGGGKGKKPKAPPVRESREGRIDVQGKEGSEGVFCNRLLLDCFSLAETCLIPYKL
jgi:hypothetical protein